MLTASNPVISGFFPDPSVCRVGEKYYSVHSTFAYFPGVPVMESEDLAHWRQIGNVLDRDSQIPLTGCGISQGIFAPTIRYHRGRWYLITTNECQGGNFIVTAASPQGPWSEPHYLGESAPGIDPSLFFDEDGRCYYIGQRERSDGAYYGDCEIWIQRLDLDTLELVEEPVTVLSGFQKSAVWPEGPHIYQRDGYYYIIHAEGGTAFHHSVMAARSRSVFGPYQYCPSNPILTHRHLGRDYPVTCAGHGDLVEDGRGNWYMLLLACRPEKGFTLLGRETFLAKVTWEDGWPVVNAGVGRLEAQVALPGEPGGEPEGPEDRDYTFNNKSLSPELLTLRNHRENILSLTGHGVRLFMGRDSLLDLGEPAYLCLRQQHRCCEIETCFQPHFCQEQDCAGIAMVQNEQNQLRAECYRQGARAFLRVIARVEESDHLVSRTDLPGAEKVSLKLRVKGLSAQILWKERESWRSAAADIDLRPLSVERSGGFVGCTMGLYASGNGADAGGYADFAFLRYRSMEIKDE